MKNPIIKVVVVVAMMLSFAFSGLNSHAHALSFSGLNQLGLIKVINLTPDHLNDGYLTQGALQGTPVPPIPLHNKLNESKKYGYIATPFGADAERNFTAILNRRNSDLDFPERYEYVEGGIDRLETVN